MARIDNADIQQVIGLFFARRITLGAEQTVDQIDAELLANLVIRQKTLVLAHNLNIKRVEPVSGVLGNGDRRRGDVVLRLGGAARHQAGSNENGEHAHV